MNRVPELIVIGAQKCGTTTLWRDLRGHPAIYMGEKESRALCGGALSARDLQARYASLYRAAPSEAVLGEVSTRYAMLPDDPDAPTNAVAVAPGARIVYIVRDPIQRVISHHHHDFGLGFVGPDIDQAIDTYPSLLDNTRYGTQIAPWLDAFGADSVRVVKFEEYMADRRAGCSSLLALAGVEDGGYDPGDAVHNAADGKPVASGGWSRIAQHPLYRRMVRPLMSEALRSRVNQVVLPKAPPRPRPPSGATLERLVEELAPEVERLAELTGQEKLWDVAESAAAHRATQR